MSKIKTLYNRITKPNCVLGSYYNCIYEPIYNTDVKISSYVPKLYNNEGKEIEFFFIRDAIRAHNPYSYSKYYFFDRYNIELKTHFYTHNSMLEQMGHPDYKYGMLIESETIVPKDYEIFRRNKGLENDFDLIFTQSERLLNEIANARFVPFCSEVWYGNDVSGGEWDPLAYQKKSKNVSIVSSDKLLCDLHKIRYNLAYKCKREKLCDTFGTFDGGNKIKLANSLTDYRYSIAIENEISAYWFTERITSCFASMTIPIYLGATKISDFFNPDGIIFITEDDCKNIEKILKNCNEKEYEQRLPAILENYEKVQQFKCCGNFMYEHYLQNRNNVINR